MTDPSVARPLDQGDVVSDKRATSSEVAAFLRSDPRTSVFSSPLWFEVLEQSYGFEIRASVLERDGRVVAAVPYCAISDIRGDRVVSTPFSDFCDPLVDSFDEWELLRTPILARGVPTSFRTVVSDFPSQDAALVPAAEHVWMAIDVPASPEDVRPSLGGSTRSMIGRGERKGVVVRASTSAADVTAWHRMQVDIRKRKFGLLAQSEDFFQAIRDQFDADGRFVLLLAEVDGEPVSGSMFIEWGDTLFFKYNASVAAVMGANEALLFHGCVHAAERGLHIVDCGLSEASHEGLIAFKRKFATREKPLRWLRHAPPGWSDPRGADAGKTLGALTQLLTTPETPPEVSASAGALLYRYFA